MSLVLMRVLNNLFMRSGLFYLSNWMRALTISGVSGLSVITFIKTVVNLTQTTTDADHTPQRSPAFDGIYTVSLCPLYV